MYFVEVSHELMAGEISQMSIFYQMYQYKLTTELAFENFYLVDASNELTVQNKILKSQLDTKYTNTKVM